MLRQIILVLLVGIPGLAFAQSTGIQGTVTDAKGEGIINVSVIVTQGGINKAVSGTDFNGQYEVKPLDPGDYDVTFTNQGEKFTITGVFVSANSLSKVDYKFAVKSLTEVTKTVSRGYVRPLLTPDGVRASKSGDEIDRLAVQNTAQVVSLSAGVHNDGRNGLSIGGGRTTGNNIIVDGVQYSGGQLGTTTLPPGAVGEIKTYASGVPARYGDASGGVVVVTSRGITPKIRGDVRLEKSVDGYGHNQGSFTVSGPLLRRYADSSHSRKVPVLGFRLSGDVGYDKDGDPVYGGVQVLNDDVRSRLEAHPLAVVSSINGPALGYAAEAVQSNAWHTVTARPNAAVGYVKLVPKVDFQINPNVSVTLGSNLYGTQGSNYNRVLGLFSEDNFSYTKGFSALGYLQFTQKFGHSGATKDNTISNAFYTVHADYKKDYFVTGDKNHGQNTFDYGYVGKFIEHYTPFYSSGVDSITQKTGIRLVGYLPQSVEFQASDKNPILAHYTQDVFDYYGESNLISQSQIRNLRGILNGGTPGLENSLWYNTGYPQTGWSKRNEDQVSLAVDASFDYKTKQIKHSIEFGLYYQQRNQRFYSIGGAGLWGLMRQLTTDVVSQTVDPKTPTFIRNGVTYTYNDVLNGTFNPSPQDTILYQRLHNSAKQGQFDKNLRLKLAAAGQDTTGYINVDALDPSFFSVDMFSADEILNNGTSLGSYYGYDYKGNLETGNVNFNDFWSKKDANGNYTRPIGAYRPNYIAGYLSDFIQFKQDVKFNIGVRVERFDNNTKVLKDPYSLYEEKTVGDVSGSQNVLNGKVHPANIGNDYVPYVASNNGTPAIIGYRNGDDWYDANGRQIEDPAVLKQNSGGLDPVPYLQTTNGTYAKISDSAYVPNGAFTDYKPQVNVMPRINFSFPINDNSLFYAHYDVLVQRPETQVEAYATPVDYFFLSQNPSNIIGNAALKPQKTIDYEVGFQQKLSRNSAITITGFYKERKDQIQVRPYLYAQPTTYYTYGNRDFSTTKGFSLSYDLQRLGNISMGINYTLQFAEGTGSDARSANGGDGGTVSSTGLLQNYLAAGLGNLQSPFALGYDSRHNINANIDYRYADGEGPVVGGKHILENAGLNLTFFTRSGEPYTEYDQAQTLLGGVHNTSVITGAVNGSRLPWHYSMNLRVEKEFAVNFHNKASIKDLRRNGGLAFIAYVAVTNLLNTRDVLNVYGYTGRAGDDGYLTSPQGSVSIGGQDNPQAFTDQYQLRENNPSQLNSPRRVSLGLQINF